MNKRMTAKVEPAARLSGAQTYQIHVLLRATQPPIWRRLQVPGNANLSWLHAVLQVAIGWTNSHLHQFICAEQVYTDPSAELESYGGDRAVLDESKAKLADVLPEIGNGMSYGYDFGDSWTHLIEVENILPAPLLSTTTASCLAGARACPPEDCGGPWGYEELLKALKNRKHPEHKNMKEWLGRPFNVEEFDPTKTTALLRKLKWPNVTEGQLRKVLMAQDGYRE